MADTLVPADDLPTDTRVPAEDLPSAAPPQQQAAPQGQSWKDSLYNLDQKYTGGMGRQLLLAGRVVPDAANGLINVIPNGLTATWNLGARMAGHPEMQGQLPSETLDKYALSSWLPKPQTSAEKAENIVGTLTAGAAMPVPGAIGDISFNPASSPGGMNRGDVQKALAILQKRLGQDNKSLPSASADVMAQNAAGIPARLPDVAGPNTLRTADALAQRPGAAQNIIRSDREAIAADTTPRVGEQVRDALDAHGDAGRYQDILAQARGEHAKANYEAVRNDPQPIMDQDIWHILENPDVAATFQQAKNMNARVRSLDATMGKTTPPLADLYAPAQAVMPRVGAEGDRLLPPPQGEPQWVRTGTAPDVRTLDFMQRALQTRIGQLYNQARSGQGTQGGEGDLATALKSARNAIVDRLKDLSPSFKKASETYGDDTEVMDAYTLGSSRGKDSFFSLSPAQAQQQVNGMSEAAKTALRMGVAERMLGQAELSGRSMDLAKVVAGGGRQKDMLWTLFDGDRTKFDTFVKAMQMESKLYKNNSSILGGSQTAGRQEAIGDFENEMLPGKTGQIADVAAQGLLHRPGVFIHGLFRMMQDRVWNPSIAATAAHILSSPDPQQAAGALQTLENSLAKMPRYQRMSPPAVKGVAAASAPSQQQLEQKYGVQP